MVFFSRIRDYLHMDSYISRHCGEEEMKKQCGVGLIAAFGFLLMSFLNISQQSYIMLISTLASSAVLFVSWFISKRINSSGPVVAVLVLIIIAEFTLYTVEGGNEGFAALWLILATYASMFALNIRLSFLINLYFLVMLMLVFNGPLSFLLQYDYNATFRLRFPFLFGINFALATFLGLTLRTFRYGMLVRQEELEYISSTDLNTGLMNRNSFRKYEKEFVPGRLASLVAIFIDVNGLHEINNTLGHGEGDRVLTGIAGLCKEYFPDSLIYRMGGDEFLILSENGDEKRCREAAERLHTAVKEAGFSISWGLAARGNSPDLEEITKEADMRMLEFKERYHRRDGRNTR